MLYFQTFHASIHSVLSFYMLFLLPLFIWLIGRLLVFSKKLLCVSSVLTTLRLGYHSALQKPLPHFLTTDHFHLEVSLDNKVPEIGTVLNL